MQYIVGFPGGVQSAYLAWQVIEKYGKENVVLLFHDTKSEPPDNYRFREQVADFLGLPITEVSDGRDIWQVCEDEGYLPNSRVRKCSQCLKHSPAEKYYKELETQGMPFTVCIGYDRQEYRRRQRMVARYPNRNFLFLDTPLNKDQIKNIIIKEWGICLPEMYQYFSRANCVPCFLQGRGGWKQTYRLYPELFERALQLEEKFGYTFGKEPLKEMFPKIKGLLNNEEMFTAEEFLPCECAF